ncbi:MAG: DUF4296 domain-containing protein [Tannerella sp.]|jgi:hypothetical protein|nr:DUF4296 domain-containing protein [Tannerella sp.]
MSNIFPGTLSGWGMVFFIVTFLFACSRTPKGIIPEKKMQRVLMDMQLAEIMIGMDPSSYGTIANKKTLYQSVFDKHQLTEAEYDSSLIWYGKHLTQYMRVYNLALADVKRQIEAIGDIKPDIAPSSNEDSLNIWIFRKYYEFVPRSLSNTVIFDLQPEEAYAYGSVFILGLQVWGIPPDRKDSVEMHINAYQGDTTLIVKGAIRHDGYHELLLKTIPTKKVMRVYGYLRLHSKDESFHKIYLDDFTLMKYKYGSPTIARMDSVAAAAITGQ